jgi:murein DD-endopeptidase MepM/ murein hydrolase activator NlpD
MRVVILLILMLFSSLFATIKDSSYIGGVAVVELKDDISKPRAIFDEKEILVTKSDNEWVALIGISLNEKREKLYIDVIYSNGDSEVKEFKVSNKEYKKQYITLKTNKHVDLAKRDLDRHLKEKEKSQTVLNQFSKLKDDISNGFKMLKPIKGMKIKDDFGKRRYFNNKPRKPHSGVDIAAREGTKIVAPLSGQVSIAKEFFFSGNVIYLDHGNGLITMYAHLSKLDVKEGDYVAKGQKIGEVGKTGRVTGSHLHFGVALNSNMVNPKLFF